MCARYAATRIATPSASIATSLQSLDPTCDFGMRAPLPDHAMMDSPSKAKSICGFSIEPPSDAECSWKIPHGEGLSRMACEARLYSDQATSLSEVLWVRRAERACGPRAHLFPQPRPALNNAQWRTAKPRSGFATTLAESSSQCSGCMAHFSAYTALSSKAIFRVGQVHHVAIVLAPSTTHSSSLYTSSFS